jgi:hypothetical protein
MIERALYIVRSDGPKAPAPWVPSGCSAAKAEDRAASAEAETDAIGIRIGPKRYLQKRKRGDACNKDIPAFIRQFHNEQRVEQRNEQDQKNLLMMEISGERRFVGAGSGPVVK